ncbi:uncharacterized protein B0I36DRAFT_351950 [Microdochium trichocladiopsis]|uniref:Developmental regulatory protein wetA n=1 Tax=Microdochium trichocladiopsis TaxID=1682393 RepID=A0A9P9BJW8_9PEZI|nr:uncharacterized protein B0I36DRAFT_351950 [Microdochium trichocladiopsis]KAH7026019.1 hypothetical protein B0I36DRAFT_351950 [Microdochium trichocladiopsis]
MAFVAAPHIMENEQNQSMYWIDHDEAEITNEHFFDQFVSFEGGDSQAHACELLQNPQSPSMLLGSAEHDAVDLASDVDVPTYGTEVEATAPITIPPRATPILRRKNNLPSVLAAGPADFATGSHTTDSDLLRLEGISLRSPRHKLPVTESPPSTRGQSLSPRKHGLLDSVYATIRKATHRNKASNKSSQPRTSIMNLDLFKSPIKIEEDVSQNTDLGSFTDDQLLTTGPIDSNGLPLSPPLTGRIPPSTMRSNGESFVTGHFEDPFSDGHLQQRPTGLSLPLAPGDIQGTTPITTPAMNTEDFYKYATTMIDAEAPICRPKQQRSTSIAEWPSEGLLTDDSQLWSDESSSSAYVTDNGVSAPDWWDNNGKIGHGFNANNAHHPGLRRASTSVLSSINTSSNQSLGFNMDSGAGHSSSSQHDEMSYEYDASEMSGLMIQMPHTQAGPQADYLIGAPVPGDSMGNSFIGTTAAVPQLPPTPSQHYIPTHQGFTEHKRPRPRAPSSGARHYGSLTSPRKPSMHRSGSRPMLREESPSPSPAQNVSVRQRSASISSVRKKKSWCRQQQQREQQQQNSRTTPNTPAGLTSSASFGSLTGMGSGAVGATMGIVGPTMPMPTGAPSGMSSRSSSVGGGLGLGGNGAGGGGISLGGIDFVNFTPSDKNVLMTGVAPSGSSKTKARREKEAADRRRRLNEAALQAVQAAGGDVEKLRLLEQGFTLET